MTHGWKNKETFAAARWILGTQDRFDRLLDGIKAKESMSSIVAACFPDGRTLCGARMSRVDLDELAVLKKVAQPDFMAENISDEDMLADIKSPCGLPRDPAKRGKWTATLVTGKDELCDEYEIVFHYRVGGRSLDECEFIFASSQAYRFATDQDGEYRDLEGDDAIAALQASIEEEIDEGHDTPFLDQYRWICDEFPFASVD